MAWSLNYWWRREGSSKVSRQNALFYLILVASLMFMSLLATAEGITTCFGISSTNSSAVCNGNGACIDVDSCQCYQGFTGKYCLQQLLGTQSILLGKEGTYGSLSKGFIGYPSTIYKIPNTSRFLVADTTTVYNMSIDGTVSSTVSGKTSQFTVLDTGSRVFFDIDSANNLYLDSKIFSLFFESYPTSSCYVSALTYNPNDGFIYGADTRNSVLFKFNSQKLQQSLNIVNVTIIAGTFGSYGFRGENVDATTAQLYTPLNIVFNKDNELIFSDMRNSRIRKINKDGKISTVVSDINGPSALAFSPSGILYFIELGSGSLKRFDSSRVTISNVLSFNNIHYKNNFLFVDENTIMYTDSSSFVIRKIVISPRCNNNFLTGEDCSIPLVSCNSIGFNNPSVCSSQGVCANNDTCVCKINYFGKDCSIFGCFGISSTSSKVCNGNGQCTAKDTCQCKTGYFGKDCSSYQCYGKTNDDSTICSGNGDCIGTDSCKCFDGFYGKQCQSKFASTSYVTRPLKTTFVTGMCFDGEDDLMLSQTYQLYKVSVNPTNITLIRNLYGTGFGVIGFMCTKQYFYYAASNTIVRGDRNTGTSKVVVDFTNGINVFGNEKIVNLSPYITGFTYSPIYGYIFSSNNLILKYDEETGNTTLLAGLLIPTQTDFSQSIQRVPTPIYNYGMYDDSGMAVPIAVEHNSASSASSESSASSSQTYYGIGSQISFINPNGFLIKDGYLYFVDGYLSLIRKLDLSTTYVSTVAGLPGSPGYIGNNQNAKQTSVWVGSGSKMFFMNNELYFSDSYNYLIRKLSNGNLIDVAGIPKTYVKAPLLNVDSLKSGFSGNPTHLVPTKDGNIIVYEGNALKYLEKTYDCAEGFTGYMCAESLKCNNISLFDPTVCNGHGKCSKVGCTCEYGFSGSNCEIATCFGLLATDANVCNGKGKCTALDTCACTDTKYYGSKCTDFSCNGIAKNSSSVCGGKGLCTKPDTCLCFNSAKDGYWNGTNCNNCRVPYEGSACLTIPTSNTCSDAITCLGNGKCNSNQKCTCNGFFSGTNCNECKTNYYGANCDIYCEAKNTCNSHGFCDERLRGCSCHSSNSLGFWSGSDCSKCQDGYYGEKCLTRIIGPAVLSNFGNSISFKLFGPPSYTRVTIDIWRLVAYTEWTMGNWGWGNLGINPKAYWTNKEQGDFVIEFGDNYAIKPDVSQFKIRTSVFDVNYYTDSSVVLMTFTSPTNPIKPTAKLLKKKLSFGSCENLLVDGSLSYSGDKQALIYHWSLSSTTATDTIASTFTELIANQTDLKFVIPTNKFPSGTHTIQLIVESSLFGAKSDPDTITLTKEDFPLPIISISGKTTFTVSRQNVPLLIKKGVLIPSCAPNNTKIISEWKQTSGPSITFIMDENGNLVITKFVTFGVQTYIFEATAALDSTPTKKATTSVTIITFVQPLKLSSSVNSLTFDSANIEVSLTDPEESTEVEEWTYSCEPNNCGNDVNSYLTTASSSKSTQLKFNRNTVNQTVIATGSNFNINLVVKKGSRQGETSFTFYFPKSAAEIPPVINLYYKSGDFINPNTWIYASFGVTVNGTMHYYWDVKYDWTLDGVYYTREDYPYKGPWFSLPASELEEGRTYTLTFSATYKGISAYYDYVFTINRTPRCTCLVNPSTIFAMDEEITMTCPNCQVSDQSYEISFGFYDSYTGTDVVLYSAGDNTFTTSLPSKRIDYWAYNPVYIKITDKNTGAQIIKNFYIQLFNPVAASIIEISNKVDNWNLISSSLPDGDPAKYIYNSVTISNSMKYMLSIIDPNAGNTRKLRVIECNGHGILINGICNCYQNYTTSDCKYSTSDFKVIQKMKGKLFKDFIGNQNKRNTSIEIISEDIMTGTLQGLQSFLSDFDYITNDIFNSSLTLLDTILSEAISKKDFAISNSLASSYVNVLDYVIDFTTNNGTVGEYKKRVSNYIQQITLLAKRNQLPGQTTFRISSNHGVYVTGKGYVQDLNSQSIKYSDDNSTTPLYVILPSTIGNALSNVPPKVSLTHTLTLMTDLTDLKEKIEGFRNISGITSNRTIISPYIVQWKMDDYEIANLTSRIIYQIPLTKPRAKTYKLRSLTESTYYYCQYLDSEGNVQQDDTCTISFSSEQVAQCSCTKQTSVFIVQSIETGQVEPVYSCNGTSSNDINVCNSHGNCTSDEICECNSEYSGKYCQTGPNENTNSSENTTNSNNSTSNNGTLSNEQNSTTNANEIAPNNNSFSNDTTSNSTTYSNVTNTSTNNSSLNNDTNTATANATNNSNVNITNPSTNNTSNNGVNGTNTTSVSNNTNVNHSNGTTNQTTSNNSTISNSTNNSTISNSTSSNTNRNETTTNNGTSNSSNSTDSNLPPTVGTFSVSPKSGIALDTVFALNCLGSSSSNLPLSYEYFYLDESVSVWKPLNEKTQQSLLSSFLPLAFNSTILNVKVVVFDSKQLHSEKQSTVIVSKPSSISNSTLNDMLQKANSKSISSSYISTTLNVISSVASSSNGKNLEQIKEATNAIVSSYVESLQSITQYTSENSIATVSAISSVSSCLNYIQDSTTSSVITQLSSLIEQVASSELFNLDDAYLNMIKTIAETLEEHIDTQLARSFSTKDKDQIEKIYQNVGKAFMKNSLPDSPARRITSKSKFYYWRKLSVNSMVSNTMEGELIDERNHFSILNGLKNHKLITDLPFVTLSFTTQLPIDTKLDFQVKIDQVSSIESEDDILSVQFYSNEDVSLSCSYWNEVSNKKVDDYCNLDIEDDNNRRNIEQQKGTARIQRTGRFIIEAAEASNYGLLALLSLLGIPILCVVAGVLAIIHCMRRKNNQSSTDIEMKEI